MLLVAADSPVARPLGPVTLRDRDGVLHFFADLKGSAGWLVVFAPACDAAPPAQSFGALHVNVTLIAPCAFADPSQSLARRLQIEPGAQPAAAFVDSDGIVRRTMRGPDTRRFLDDTAAWFDGKVIYEAECRRCHGVDGLDDSYSGIKTIAGIARRIPENRILEFAERTGNTDLHALDERRRRALAIYVAGL